MNLQPIQKWTNLREGSFEKMRSYLIECKLYRFFLAKRFENNKGAKHSILAARNGMPTMNLQCKVSNVVGVKQYRIVFVLRSKSQFQASISK